MNDGASSNFHLFVAAQIGKGFQNVRLFPNNCYSHVTHRAITELECFTTLSLSGCDINFQHLFFVALLNYYSHSHV